MSINCSECGLELEEEIQAKDKINRYSFFKEKDIEDRQWSKIGCLCVSCYSLEFGKNKGPSNWVELKPPRH